MASPRGALISSHLWPEQSYQLLCATPTAHWLEYADWWNAILKTPLTIENGVAMPTGRAGSGMEWDERVVEQYLV
jgi:mandelate racemase